MAQQNNIVLYGTEQSDGIEKPSPIPEMVINALSPTMQIYLDALLANNCRHPSRIWAQVVLGKQWDALTEKEQKKCSFAASQALNAKRKGRLTWRARMAQTYIAYRRHQAAWRAQVTLDTVIANAAKSVFVDRAELIEKVKERLDLKGLNFDERAVLEGCDFESYSERGVDGEQREVKRVKLKLTDKTAARKQLLDYLGANDPNGGRFGPQNRTKNLSEDEKQALLAEWASQVGPRMDEIPDAICTE